MLAPGLAGARRNPFWVYFWLKSARGRRSKKMAVFLWSKGRFLAIFHQIWTSEGPNVVKILSARVSDPFPVTFPGGKFWYHVKKKLARFWARREARFAICPFFYEKIFFRPALFLSRLERPKKAAKRTRVGFRSCGSALATLLPPSTPDRAAGSEVPGSAGALVRFGAHSPPTRRRLCFMPRGTARARLTTNAAILPTR